MLIQPLHRALLAACLVAAPALVAQAQPAPAAVTPPAVVKNAAPGVHILRASLETTQWGWFSNSQAPVLTIKPGDTVSIETWPHAHSQIVPGASIEALTKLRTDHPGRGPHTLTGPIFVEGAEPGDAIKIRINHIVTRAFGSVFNIPSMFGQFPDRFKQGQVKYLYLDQERGIAKFAPNIEVPLAPFPGTMGVARAEPGQYSSVPPDAYAGNMDIRDFRPGSTLYVPAFVRGGLIWTGDSHAAQGNGEISLTAIETAFSDLNVTIDVIKGGMVDGERLTWPRIETPTHWITMHFDRDLNLAYDGARIETAKLLAAQRKLPLAAAEAMVPRVADCRVSQVVNIKSGVHCMTPKDASKRDIPERPTAETRELLVSAATDASLKKAMDDASWGMLQVLQKQKGLTDLDSYGLASIAMDCRVGQVTTGAKSIHCVMPKSLWTDGK